MKILKILSGIFIMILGLAVIVFAWLFFYTDDEATIIFAALLVSLLIGTIVFSLGLGTAMFSMRKKENKDE